jgi:hypothetical protein
MRSRRQPCKPSSRAIQRRAAVQKRIEFTLRLSIRVEDGMFTQFFADWSQGRMIQNPRSVGQSLPGRVTVRGPDNRAGARALSPSWRAPASKSSPRRPADRRSQSHSSPPDWWRAQRRPGRFNASEEVLRLVGASRFERIQLGVRVGCDRGQISSCSTPSPAVRDRTPCGS